jgi:hypothetical protein
MCIVGEEMYLDESNIVGLFSEALTADVEAVFADQTCTVSAYTAVNKHVSQFSSHHIIKYHSFVYGHVLEHSLLLSSILSSLMFCSN